jgi:predicted DNA-binding transcriptional regulator AlpA
MATTQDKLQAATSEAAIIAVRAGEVLIPAPVAVSELGITRRTLARWWDDPKLGFPSPTRINGRVYFSRTALEEWKIARLRASVGRAA